MVLLEASCLTTNDLAAGRDPPEQKPPLCRKEEDGKVYGWEAVENMAVCDAEKSLETPEAWAFYSMAIADEDADWSTGYAIRASDYHSDHRPRPPVSDAGSDDGEDTVINMSPSYQGRTLDIKDGDHDWCLHLRYFFQGRWQTSLYQKKTGLKASWDAKKKVWEESGQDDDLATDWYEERCKPYPSRKKLTEESDADEGTLDVSQSQHWCLYLRYISSSRGQWQTTVYNTENGLEARWDHEAGNWKHAGQDDKYKEDYYKRHCDPVPTRKQLLDEKEGELSEDGTVNLSKNPGWCLDLQYRGSDERSHLWYVWLYNKNTGHKVGWDHKTRTWKSDGWDEDKIGKNSKCPWETYTNPCEAREVTLRRMGKLRGGSSREQDPNEGRRKKPHEGRKKRPQ